MIKEQAILLLPWVWFCGKPWLWDRKQWGQGIIVGITAIIPFIFYYLVRQKISSGRGFALVPLAELFSFERYKIYLLRINYHLGETTSLFILIVFLLAVLLLFRSKKYRLPLICILGGTFTQFYLFFWDSNSAKWLGYYRFSMIGISILLSTLFCLEEWRKAARNSLYVKIMCAFLFLVSLINLIPSFKLALAPSTARNFLEHTDSPIYLPIRALISKAESRNTLKSGDRIYISDNTGYQISGIQFHYRHFSDQYTFTFEQSLICKCRPGYKGILIPFIFFGGMNNGLQHSPRQLSTYAPTPDKWLNQWINADNAKTACLNEIERTCTSVFTEEIGGELVGILGIR